MTKLCQTKCLGKQEHTFKVTKYVKLFREYYSCSNLSCNKNTGVSGRQSNDNAPSAVDIPVVTTFHQEAVPMPVYLLFQKKTAWLLK